MIVAILQHFVRPGMIEGAERRINANGDRMAAIGGLPLPRRAGLVRRSVQARDAHRLESREHYEGLAERLQADATIPAEYNTITASRISRSEE